jgi:hypothetical protein
MARAIIRAHANDRSIAQAQSVGASEFALRILLIAASDGAYTRKEASPPLAQELREADPIHPA